VSTDLRSDAAANRARVIEAARAAFAEHGPDITVDEIARLAGVGVGTLYRRFPVKEDLVRAILEERVAELLALLHTSAQDCEPLTAIEDFLDAVVRIQAEDRGVLRLMAQALGPAAYPDNIGELYDAVWRLLRAGQRAGQVRADVKKQDVPALLRMANAAVSPADAPCDGLKAARRCTSIVVAGLRPAWGAPANAVRSRPATRS
jgi:AcrR family transcriptional regulator